MSSINLSRGILEIMGRDKLKRQLQFKPLCRHFGAKGCESSDVIRLLHEEMEALYLMDTLGLYQADAAERMEVSRSTFARIIKSARQKVSMMLVSGADLVIEDEKEDYRVLVASMQRERVATGKPDAPFLLLFHVHGGEILEERVYENPAFSPQVRPGQVLPLLCNELQVNFFVADKIGSGLKSALLSKGVYARSTPHFTKQALFKMLTQ